jgi:hypothetical protein
MLKYTNESRELTKQMSPENAFPSHQFNVRPQENLEYADQMEFRSHTHLGHTNSAAVQPGSPVLMLSLPSQNTQ